MTIDELKAKLKTFTPEDKFGLLFVKQNGEERDYDDCRVGVHIVNENAVRHGLSASEQDERGNLLFYTYNVNEGQGGYRNVKYANIKKFTYNNEVHEIC